VVELVVSRDLKYCLCAAGEAREQTVTDRQNREVKCHAEK
jgi:hypothetical protein